MATATLTFFLFLKHARKISIFGVFVLLPLLGMFCLFIAHISVTCSITSFTSLLRFLPFQWCLPHLHWHSWSPLLWLLRLLSMSSPLTSLIVLWGQWFMLVLCTGISPAPKTVLTLSRNSNIYGLNLVMCFLTFVGSSQYQGLLSNTSFDPGISLVETVDSFLHS